MAYGEQDTEHGAVLTCGGDDGIIAGDVRCVGSLDEPGTPIAASPTCRRAAS